jgi:hypothetical protein
MDDAGTAGSASGFREERGEEGLLRESRASHAATTTCLPTSAAVLPFNCAQHFGLWYLKHTFCLSDPDLAYDPDR